MEVTMDSSNIAEFVQSNDLPANVAVVGGSYSQVDGPEEGPRHVNIKQGNIIKLNLLTAESVNLHYTDADTGTLRKVNVSSDLQLKFVVLTDDKRDEPRSRTDETRTFSTIRELLDVNPGKFKANSDYEDANISGMSIKSGDVFHTCRIIPDGQGKPSCLECVSNKGEILVLPLSCHGDFSVIHNREEFTLKQLVARGHSNSRIQLADNSTNSDLTNKSLNGTPRVGKKGYQDDLQLLGDFPISFKGPFNMQVRDIFVEGNIWGTENSCLRIPLTADLRVRPYLPDEYESPVANSISSTCCKLRDAINTYRDDLPIIVSLVSYSKIPEEFSEHLFKTQDIVVHAVDEVHKVLGVCDDTTNICIDRNVEAMCQTVPRTLRKISDLKNCVDTNILILENIASDVPYPFSLKFGDTLSINKFEIRKTKLRSGRKFLSDCEYIKCFKSDAISNETTIVKLPLDLEIIMLELLKPEISRFHMRKVFSGIVDLPSDVIIYETENSDKIPLNCPLRICNKIWDSVAVVSPLQRTADMEPYVKTFEPRISNCLEIPLRHDVLVAFKRKLDLPARYFKMPLDTDRISIMAEEISETTLKGLEGNTADYECFLPTIATRGTISKGVVANKLKTVRRLGRSISSTIRSRSRSSHPEKRFSAPSNLSSMNRFPSSCSFTTTEPSHIEATVSDEEEHLYETVDFSVKKQTKPISEEKKRQSGIFGFLHRSKKEDSTVEIK